MINQLPWAESGLIQPFKYLWGFCGVNIHLDIFHSLISKPGDLSISSCVTFDICTEISDKNKNMHEKTVYDECFIYSFYSVTPSYTMHSSISLLNSCVWSCKIELFGIVIFLTSLIKIRKTLHIHMGQCYTAHSNKMLKSCLFALKDFTMLLAEEA